MGMTKMGHGLEEVECEGKTKGEEEWNERIDCHNALMG